MISMMVSSGRFSRPTLSLPFLLAGVAVQMGVTVALMFRNIGRVDQAPLPYQLKSKMTMAI